MQTSPAWPGAAGSAQVTGAQTRATEPVEACPFALWPGECRCELDGRVVPLTRREFDVLLALVRAAGHLVHRARLYELAWGEPFTVGQRDVDAYVRKLRRKLNAAAPGWTFIHTHNWIGYRLWPERRQTR